MCFRSNIRGCNLLNTSILASPALLVALSGLPAYATCNLISGGGSVAIPNNGAVVTCDTIAPHSTQIGDGSTSATLNLDENAIVDTVTDAVRLDRIMGNLGASSQINSQQTAIESVQDATLVLEAGARIMGSTGPSIDANGAINLQLGSGSQLGSSADRALRSGQSITITGNADNVSITTAAATAAIFAPDVTVNLGDNATLSSSTVSVRAINELTLRVGQSSTINSNIVSDIDSVLFTPGTDSEVLAANLGISAPQGIIVDGGGDDVRIEGTAQVGLFSTGGPVGVSLGDRAHISGSLGAIIAAQDVDVNVGADSTITATSNAAINTGGNANVIPGGGTTISGHNGVAASQNVTISGGANNVSLVGGTNIGVLSNGGDVNVVLGEGAIITGDAAALQAFSDIDASFGAGASITSASGSAIEAVNGTATIDLGPGSMISAANTAITNARDVTLGLDAQVTSAGAAAIAGTAGADTIDLAGMVSGNGNALTLNGGDDSLILRSGARLAGTADGGSENDTITLLGSGEIAANFVNFEALEMLGEEWALDGTNVLGTTTIESGELSLGGTSTTDIIVNGGVFKGTGNLIGELNNVGGRVAPGNSIGTQFVIGNFTQSSGGTLEIEVDANSIDLLAVTGSAILGGKLEFVFTDIPEDGDIKTFLTATSGVTGSFIEISDNLLFYDTNVNANANDVHVTFDRLAIASTPASRTESEASVAMAVDALSVNSPELNMIVNGFGSFAQASDFLGSQTGLAATGLIDTALFAQRNNGSTALRHSRETISTLINQTDEKALSENNSLWADISLHVGSVDGDEHARGFDFDLLGVAGGIEHQMRDASNLTLGAFAAVTDLAAKPNGLGDRGDGQTYQAGLYAHRPAVSGLDLSGTLSMSFSDLEVDRKTITGEARSEFSAVGLYAATEAGFPLKTAAWSIAPFVGLDLNTLRSRSYNENGAGVLNLKVDAGTNTQLSTQLGVRGHSPIIDLGSGFMLHSAFEFAWESELTGRQSKSVASFKAAPANQFTSQTPTRDSNSARLNFELIARPSETINLEFTMAYNGDLSSDNRSHGFNAGMLWRW